ncbi:hypothetical protein LWI29_028761 [Acer saccharum]|uniref:Uncharacterized protein n=1 Tax=Acer saccharum TaxID=4024 RepID=A0AA39VE83_ACESA|nr:hypothetical protein LWI29_028761 [Acer saccharum]
MYIALKSSLFELISSKLAVDISRHRDEINLASLAIHRIQKRAVDELIDPCLGFLSDEEVKRMATSVAELAFLCLQQNKEMRHSMDFVLEELQRIKSGECKLENLKEEDDGDKEELKSTPPHCEESVLLKNIKLPPSPISVTENWLSTTNNPHSGCVRLEKGKPILRCPQRNGGHLGLGSCSDKEISNW